jgi:predicted helicase
MPPNSNYGLLSCRQQSTFDFQHAFITKSLADMCSVSLQTKETGYYFPLYTYSKESKNQKSIIEVSERQLNLNSKIVLKIAKGINHTFVPDDDIVVEHSPNVDGAIYPLNILDYIYAVLHSPSYREKYKEFLKIDFPRVPYPTDADKFCKLVALGKELREIHLLESPKVNEFITEYHGDSDNIVGKPVYKNGSVYINEIQYFKNVQEVAWNFYIGGYQPSQKWLKDRKGRELSYEDVLHYQKVIVALTKTQGIMGEIDGVLKV